MFSVEHLVQPERFWEGQGRTTGLEEAPSRKAEQRTIHKGVCIIQERQVIQKDWRQNF
jgi:hypothetical protein